MDKNIFVNNELYDRHYSKEYRKDRLNDFIEIYNILKKHLEPTERARIDDNLIKEYINSYKKENKDFITNLLHNTYHITFEKFKDDLNEQIKILNDRLRNKNYIYVIGVNNNSGSSNININIYKSNLWTFMLIYDKLETKPYDILLNLKIAIKLYDNKYDILIVDDCCYTGTQMVENVLYENASETLFKYPNSFLVYNDAFTKPLFKPIHDKIINIHLFIPYLSNLAYIKLKKLDLITCFNVILYNKYILNSLYDILSFDDRDKLLYFYEQYNYKINPLDYVPVFFDHKIADTVSTIELILIKGQVLDNPNKKIIFIKPCDKYYHDLPSNKINNVLLCPKSPYYDFKDILKNYKK